MLKTIAVSALLAVSSAQMMFEKPADFSKKFLTDVEWP